VANPVATQLSLKETRQDTNLSSVGLTIVSTTILMFLHVQNYLEGKKYPRGYEEKSDAEHETEIKQHILVTKCNSCHDLNF
jgi:hypothetical protein